MPSPDTDFRNIRLHRGTQSDAFEELCCQLAADEAEALGARFVRKGRGADAGVEAFAILPNGREIGWQVKYYWKVEDVLPSLSDSLAAALDKHPAMERFVVCLPFDLPDSRKPNTRTALGRFNTWRMGEKANAASAGRTIDVELWSAATLKDRLTADSKAAGRIHYWFDAALLTPEWFARKQARAVADLGARYTPSTNVKLPIRYALLAVARDSAFVEELRLVIEHIEAALSLLPTSDAGAMVARQAVDAAVAALTEAVDADPGDIGQAQIVDLLATAESTVARWRWAEFDRSRSSDVSRAANRLYARVADARARLASERWRLINTRRLLVTGRGGSGKSHLLADTCQHQIDRGYPALLVLAHLLKDDDPWSQIVDSLDLPRHLPREAFLTALNSAAQAQGVRALVVVDGINERAGLAIWFARMAGFLHDLGPYPWISVVLSCRDTYVDLTIPANLDETALPRLAHYGFSTADAERYLDLRGVTTLDAPWPLAEFDTPLFLKTLCDGLALTGQTTLPRGSQGLTKIFDLYAKAIADTVQRDLGLNPKLGHVGKVLSVVAAEIARTGDAAIPYARSDALATAILPNDGRTDRDLLFRLIDAGLLVTDLVGAEEVVRFTFERFGDYVVARGLLEGCATRADVESRLSSFLNSTPLYTGGVLEALGVVLPERFGVELPDISMAKAAPWVIEHAFRESLTTREVSAFQPRTWDLIRELGGESEAWEARIRLASEPKADQNAEELHALLAAMPMPKRDLLWSVHLATSSRAATELIDWALRPRKGALAEPRARLVAITLTWFLTTSHRGVRDRATKALVAILADRPALVSDLLTRFLDIDDGYVVERLLCAIYGAALQGRWPHEAAAAAVRAVDCGVFRERPPPVNCLAREHGRLLIRWAITHAVLPGDYDTAPSEGPFDTPWPIEHVPEAVIDSFTRTYGTGYVGTDDIVSSCVRNGDFARYVLDRVVDGWSPARRGTSPLPTREALHDAWLSDFERVATLEALTAYAGLVKALERDRESSPWQEGPEAIAAKAAFAAAAGSEMFERWREEAENWRRHGMYQGLPTRDHAEFNLAWARRWVCLRAHQLGWSEQAHGTFDDSVHNDRMSHHVERIGKKYQWLALYELRARMADNLQPTRVDPVAEPDELRAIDPSLLAGTRWDDELETEEREEATPLEAEPWSRSVRLDAIRLDDALVWRDDDEDLPDGLDGIEFALDGRSWLAIKGFDSWRGGPESLHRQLSRWMTCVVVRQQDLAAFLSLVEGQTDLDHDSFNDGEGRVPWRSYLGEHPWAWIEENTGEGWSEPWKPRSATRRGGVPVRATTTGYLAEDRGYDRSLGVTVDARLPLRWLMDALDLRLGDGRAIEYINEAGRALFRDPTAEGGSETTALIDREAFLDLLRRNQLAAVWLIGGEKNVYGSGRGNGFGGRRYYARVAQSTGGELTLGARASRLEGPAPDQLRTLRAANPDRKDTST